MTIRIGTRTSKMAMAQAKTVAAKMRAAHPDLEIEFVGITSLGDRDKKTPLWQLDTVGIFSRDIDEKLLAGEIDCAVHSLKDLGTKRPDALQMAALLKRENPRDIAIFRPDVLDKIKRDQPIIIGSSAPRRTELVPKFLSRALPQLGSRPPVVQMIPLRGNVNTRLKKLREADDAIVQMDGIVVALGGLGRLDGDDESHDELRAAVQGLKMMVMPLTECPGAPGQGTIVVEAHADRPEILELCSHFHDAATAAHYAHERAVLLQHGGGCHQKFGVACVDVDNIADPIVIIRGKNKSEQDVSALRWATPAPQRIQSFFDGQEWSEQIFSFEKLPYDMPHAQAAFIAHHRACPDNLSHDMRLWVSGPSSWFKLAQKGLWIEGCADGFGFSFVRDTLSEPFLALPPLSEWAVFTNEGAAETWTGMPVTATYRLHEDVQHAAIDALRQADLIWWSSAAQYRALQNHVPAHALHACGPGKTAAELGHLNPRVFPSREECRAWVMGGQDTIRQKESS